MSKALLPCLTLCLFLISCTSNLPHRPVNLTPNKNSLLDSKFRDPNFRDPNFNLLNDNIFKNVDEILVLKRNKDSLINKSINTNGNQFTNQQEILRNISKTSGLVAKVVHQKKEKFVPLPLEKTTVDADLDEIHASVKVNQKYTNPFSKKIELIYRFPLASNAAVKRFMIKIGERKILGLIREAEEADFIYNEAKHAGYLVSLLNMDKANLFIHKLANVEPEKTISIELQYDHIIKSYNSKREFIFPLLVGPRFTTDSAYQINDLFNKSFYLKPNEISTHEVDINIQLKMINNIKNIQSLNHKISVDKLNQGNYKIRLNKLDKIPNKDFILSYEYDKNKTAKSFYSLNNNEKYFVLPIHLPELNLTENSPKEYIFLIDNSIAMQGQSIKQAKAFIFHTIQQLSPKDRFQVLALSKLDKVKPIIASENNKILEKIKLDLIKIQPKIKSFAVLEHILEHQKANRKIIYFSNGFVKNERVLHNYIRKHIKESQLFSVGVGNSVNRNLMDGIAEYGNGLAFYLGLNDDAIKMSRNWLSEINKDLMTDIKIDWSTLSKSGALRLSEHKSLSPRRPLLYIGKLKEFSKVKINVQGKINDKPIRFNQTIDFSKAIRLNNLNKIYARTQIKALMTDLMKAKNEENKIAIKGEIVKQSIKEQVQSVFTTQLSMDASRITEGDHGISIKQKLPLPEGFRYETKP